jgi:anaerobic magnesium-protoporphyrin IX monomethyl ester cyclase
MTREDITRLRQIAFKKFYSRPRFIARKVLGIRGLHDIRAAFTGFKSLFWVWVKQDLFRRGEGLH